jgi:succinyl-CoA synthetase beta subunit
VYDLPEIAEIEINPLTVLKNDVVAVDVRVKMS